MIFLVLGVLLAGCDQHIIDTDDEREIIVFFTARSLSASLLKSTASEAEKYIEDILVFGVDGNGIVAQTFIIPQLDEQYLSNGIVLESVSRLVKSFYAIANPSAEMKTEPYPSNVSELLSMTCAFSSSPKTPFVMSGVGNIVSGYVAQIDLVRTVAKIEITASPNFEIEKITVANTPGEGYLFKRDPLSVPDVSMTTYQEIEPLTPSLATLYVAENNKDTPTQFIVTGQFDGQTVSYTVEFSKNGAKIDIERNKHYMVEIIAITHSKGQFTITVPDWEDVVSDAKIMPRPKNPLEDGINIFSIGNSYSEDAMRYLFELLTQLGVNSSKTKIINAYIDGGTVVDFAKYIDGDQDIYNRLRRQHFLADGIIDWDFFTGGGVYSLQELIEEAEWDFIILQQQSYFSHEWTDIESEALETVLEFIQNNMENKKYRLGWNMTWSFSQSLAFDEDDWLYLYFPEGSYGMYLAMCNAVYEKIIPHDAFDFIIPTGTAIQNARSSALFGDNLNHDGGHLNNLGNYTAAAMLAKTLTGYDIMDLQTGYIANKGGQHPPDSPHPNIPNPPVTITQEILDKVVQAVNAAHVSPFLNLY